MVMVAEYHQKTFVSFHIYSLANKHETGGIFGYEPIQKFTYLLILCLLLRLWLNSKLSNLFKLLSHTRSKIAHKQCYKYTNKCSATCIRHKYVQYNKINEIVLFYIQRDTSILCAGRQNVSRRILSSIYRIKLLSPKNWYMYHVYGIIIFIRKVQMHLSIDICN